MVVLRDMIAKNNNDAAYAAEIIGYLARFAYKDSQCNLTRTQWMALGFFGRANKISRTLSDFANYHVTTRGSASQTVKSLVAKGFLTRVLSEKDKRSARFDLTDKGRNYCRSDPFNNLVRSVAGLPESRQVTLAAILNDLLENLVEGPQGRYLGSCSTCQFLKERIDQKYATTDYFCVHSGEELSDLDFQKICMKYKSKMSAIG